MKTQNRVLNQKKQLFIFVKKEKGKGKEL